jgi:membrane fusion protein, multidrug efflux system
VRSYRPVCMLVALLSLPCNAQAQSMLDGVLSCLLEPSEDILLGTPAEGVLVKVNVERSDPVRKGQVLAELDTALEVAAINTQMARAEFATRRMERVKSLQQAQLIPEQELDEIRTEQKLAQLEVAERKAQLRLKELRSPINGVVVERFASRGDLIQKNEIFRIMQLDPLYVEVVLALSWFGKIALGQEYSVYLQHLETQHSARVINVDAIVDPASSTFRVRMSLPNPEGRIPSGLRCELFSPTTSGSELEG